MALLGVGLRLRTVTFGVLLLGIATVLSGLGAGPAQAKYDCGVDARLGGGKDQAVIVGVRCEERLGDLSVSSHAGPVTPFPNAWTKNKVGKNLCHRKRVDGIFSGGCNLLFRFNFLSPQRVVMAVRITGDRCSGGLILGLGADERCEGACRGLGTGEKMKLPRPAGC